MEGRELWVSDGTTAGTNILKDIRPGYDPSIYSDLQEKWVLDTLLFFPAYETTHSRELWVTNGTTSGTHLLKDINPTGSGSASSSNPEGFTPFNGKMAFFADDGVHGLELWLSDGTESGTNLVKDVYPGEQAGGDIIAVKTLDSLLIFSVQEKVETTLPLSPFTLCR